MSNDKLLNIPVVFAGRTYPVLVTEKEAKSLKLINDQLNEEFLDLQGRYANKLNKGVHEFDVNLSDFDKGLYFLSVSSNNQNLTTKKLIVK